MRYNSLSISLLALCVGLATASRLDDFFSTAVGSSFGTSEAVSVAASSSQDSPFVKRSIQGCYTDGSMCLETVTDDVAGTKTWIVTKNVAGELMLGVFFGGVETGLVFTPAMKRNGSGFAYNYFKLGAATVVNQTLFSATFSGSWSQPSYRWNTASISYAATAFNGAFDLNVVRDDSGELITGTVTSNNYYGFTILITISSMTSSVVTKSGTTATYTVAPAKLEKVTAGRELGGPATASTVIFTVTPTAPGVDFYYQFSWNARRGNAYAIHDSSIVYEFPFVGTFPVNQGYGGTFSHFNESRNAIDFGLPEGTDVYSSRGGIVVDSVNSNTLSMFTPGVCPLPVTLDCNTTGAGANQIIVLQSDDTLAIYTHLQQNGALKSVGDTIAPKVLIGKSGNTGYSSGAHLHVEIRRPLSFFEARSSTNGWTYETISVTYVTASGDVVTPLQDQSYTSAQGITRALRPGTSASRLSAFASVAVLAAALSL